MYLLIASQPTSVMDFVLIISLIYFIVLAPMEVALENVLSFAISELYINETHSVYSSVSCFAQWYIFEMPLLIFIIVFQLNEYTSVYISVLLLMAIWYVSIFCNILSTVLSGTHLLEIICKSVKTQCT